MSVTTDDLMRVIEAQAAQLRALQDAVERQSALLASLNQPEVGSDLTVQKLRDAYEDAVKTRACPITIRCRLEPAVAYFGPRHVLSLRPSDWTHYRDAVRAEFVTERGAKISPGTLNNETTTFLAMINWAVNDKRLARNPLGRIPPLPVQEPESVIDRADEPAIMRASSPTLRAMFLLGVDVGLRLNEVRILEWEWVDFDAMCIHLPAWATKTRTAGSPRITQRVAEELRSLPRMLRCKWVFPNPDTGAPYSKVAIGTWWRQMRAEVGIKVRPGERAPGFHITRHTAGTRINRVSGVKVAMKQLRQTSPAVALKYIHADDSDLDDMRAKLDAELTVSARRPPQRTTSETAGTNEKKSSQG